MHIFRSLCFFLMGVVFPFVRPENSVVTAAGAEPGPVSKISSTAAPTSYSNDLKKTCGKSRF